MSTRPLLSLGGSCARPELWPRFLDALSKNGVPFEVVLCGPRAPLEPLPPFARWIEATTKPVQCLEVAWRALSGELLSTVTDDLEYSPGALDAIWETYCARRDAGEPDAIVSPLYHAPFDFPGQSAAELTAWAQTFDQYQRKPPIPVQGFIPAYKARELGGFDRRFVGVQADVDYWLRAQVAGCRVHFEPRAVATERTDWCVGFKRLSSRYHWQTDRPLVCDLWRDGGPTDGIGFERTSPLEPFIDDGRLCTFDQGKT